MIRFSSNLPPNSLTSAQINLPTSAQFNVIEEEPVSRHGLLSHPGSSFGELFVDTSDLQDINNSCSIRIPLDLRCKLWRIVILPFDFKNIQIVDENKCFVDITVADKDIFEYQKRIVDYLESIIEGRVFASDLIMTNDFLVHFFDDIMREIELISQYAFYDLSFEEIFSFFARILFLIDKQTIDTPEKREHIGALIHVMLQTNDYI